MIGSCLMFFLKLTIYWSLLRFSNLHEDLENHFKLLMRWYHASALLHKFFPTTTDHFWRCQEGQRTFLHIFWSCPKLEYFWKEVQRIVQTFTDYEVPDDLAFFLLYISVIPAKIYKWTIIRHLLNTAKSSIPFRCIRPQPPTINVKSTLKLEHYGICLSTLKRGSSFWIIVC